MSQLPFCQTNKRKIVIRKVQGDDTQVRIYVKGAPEYVIGLCGDTLDSEMNQQELQDDEKEKLIFDIASNGMARDGLKTISFAYKQLALDDFNLLTSTHHIESEDFRNEIEADLVYIGTFGLEDPIRPGVENSIQLIRYGAILGERVDRSKGAKNQVNIRMVTGDHVDTALYVAKETGIISEEESNLHGIYLTGDQFREAVGEYTKIWDEQAQKWIVEFKEPERFKEVKSRLRIIARATAEDKFLLIAGIKQAGGLVAMSGQSVADAQSLKEADIGLCMGSGCQVAKDNSDLVILDNDFASIYRAIKWGQAIFNNVRKFIQFQMTINIVLCLFVFIHGATLGQSPFNVIQLLWANLIMDILGAIAICTEPPGREKQLSSAGDTEVMARVSRKDKIITLGMWRTILVQAAW